jgi:hypothetical protein
MNNPSVVFGHRAKVETELKKAGLDLNTPSYITETGMYPGPSGDGPDVEDDLLSQAAGVAALHYWFIEDSPRNYPFHWILRHPTNGRKDQLRTARNGTTAIPGNGITGIFSPYGNMLLMQKMMKTTRVRADSFASARTEGKGIYLLAAKDTTGASIMVWNFKGSAINAFPVTMTGLSSIFPGNKFTMKTYSIDSQHSNYTYDDGALKMVDEKTVDMTALAGGEYTTTLALEPNSVHLLLLEP